MFLKSSENQINNRIIELLAKEREYGTRCQN